MNQLRISSKKKLKNGDECCIVEQNFSGENFVRSNAIKINGMRTPIKTATIFLTRDDNYVGHITANLYSNQTASLIMSGIRSVELPEPLSKYREIIEQHDVALLVDEKYRRQGKATQLIQLMLQYLQKNGIRDLEVNSISDDIAMKTYLSSGAEKIDESNAIYRNIERLITREKEEMER